MAIAAFTYDAQQRNSTGAWAALASGDTGAPVQVAPDALISVQAISGTFAAQTLTWEGSLDGVNFVQLPDIKGVLMAMTAPGLLGVGQPIQWIRPNMGGAGASAVITRLVAVRAN